MNRDRLSTSDRIANNGDLGAVETIKLRGLFTKKFYGYYKQGFSSAEALQKGSLELIRDKSGNMHEPYYWADFTVNGDYR